MGLDAIPALTSFAYTNIGELSGLAVPLSESLRTKRGGLDEIEDPGPSLITLDALDLWPGVDTLNPRPLEARTSCRGVPRFSMKESGLGFLGILLEVSFGVDDALSTLAFLEADRGVILELKKALTGVATSLPLPVPLGDCVIVLAIGRRLRMPFCFSEFIAAAPCGVVVAERLYGISFWCYSYREWH